jgi:hypothetical protein
MSTLALCPSRNRPTAAHETLRSFLETRRDPASRLVFSVDSDDATLAEYPEGYVHVVPPTGTMGGALRVAAADPALLGDATSVGMVGDDNRFVAPGWDRTLDGWLTDNIGIAYGDDGFQHEKLPTSWWMSRAIVDEFGMTNAALRHFYMDNWAKALGEAVGCLRYFPDVSIEHLHPIAGKAEDDAVYKRSRRNIMHDRQQFHRWVRRGLPNDAARLRRIIKGDTPRIVLADWHHPALWESLSILFEDRFGWRLYSPTGADWTAHGWRLENGTPGWSAKDYLVFDDLADCGTHFERIEREYPERPRKLLTWQQAETLRPDVVLASVAVHQRPFAALAKRWGARFAHQVGNARHPIDRNVEQTVLASAIGPRGSNVLPYHPEFDRRLFDYTGPGDPSRVTSFMLRRDTTSCDPSWLAEAPGVRFSEVGGKSPRDPAYLAPMSKVAGRMREAGWIWADKRIGDGYGFVLHQAMAMGRPLIGHASHYAGMLAEPLWRDLDTCIDLDRHSETDVLRLWRAIGADPEWLADLSARTAATFEESVDWDTEAETIRVALA